jgi:hypothetical protein
MQFQQRIDGNNFAIKTMKRLEEAAIAVTTVNRLHI